MLSGYHTAGLLQHDIVVAIEELARLGYRSVAVRPRQGMLAIGDAWFGQQLLRIADATARNELQLVFDLDSRFMHSPWKSRGPSLSADEPEEALAARNWIETWLGLAAESGASLITFSSGIQHSHGNEIDSASLTRLASELDHLVHAATQHAVKISLRPRFGDTIATVAQFERLQQWLETEQLGLAADIGEMLQGHEIPLADRLDRNRASLSCVYLCDRLAGLVEDQPLGKGDVAHGRLIARLREMQFGGPLIVRIESHSQLGLTLAEQAIRLFDEP